MDLSPNDIRNYEFPSQLRGYDKDEVDAFLDKVAGALEEVKQQNMKLSMELDSVKGQLQNLRQFEDTIKGAAIDARRNADLTVASAKKEAEEALSKAKAEAENIISSHHRQLAMLESQIERLREARNSYLSNVRQMMNSHIELIDKIAEDKPAEMIKLDKTQEEKLEITESTEVKNRKRETVATQPSKAKGIRTEEAKAASEIVTAAPDAETEMTLGLTDEPAKPDDEMAERLKQAIRDQEAGETPKNIDPELAAALESYQKGVGHQQPGADASGGPVPPPDEIVETTRRAEDIPPEFVAIKNGLPVSRESDENADDTDDVDSDDNGDTGDNEESEKITNRVSVAPEAQDQPTEHNTISIDNGEEHGDNAVSPDNLAEELDKVVAKFEEEMDKAAKS